MKFGIALVSSYYQYVLQGGGHMLQEVRSKIARFRRFRTWPFGLVPSFDGSGTPNFGDFRTHRDQTLRHENLPQACHKPSVGVSRGGQAARRRGCPPEPTGGGEISQMYRFRTQGGPDNAST